MFGLHLSELLVIFGVVLLVFGPARLPAIGDALGRTVRALRDGLSGGESSAGRAGAIPDDAARRE